MLDEVLTSYEYIGQPDNPRKGETVNESERVCVFDKASGELRVFGGNEMVKLSGDDYLGKVGYCEQFKTGENRQIVVGMPLYDSNWGDHMYDMPADKKEDVRNLYLLKSGSPTLVDGVFAKKGKMSPIAPAAIKEAVARKKGMLGATAVRLFGPSEREAYNEREMAISVIRGFARAELAGTPITYAELVGTAAKIENYHKEQLRRGIANGKYNADGTYKRVEVDEDQLAQEQFEEDARRRRRNNWFVNHVIRGM